MQLHLSGTGSRTFDAPRGPASEEETVLVRAAAEAVPEVLAADWGHRGSGAGVELLHVNCEGCEYDVVDGLRRAALLPQVEQVQIATHLLDAVDPSLSFQEALEVVLQLSVRRYCEMHEILSETHSRVWGL